MKKRTKKALFIFLFVGLLVVFFLCGINNELRIQEYDVDSEKLSGHAHGGQWRIPGLVNGLLAPNQGLFPRYAGGKYTVEDTTMITSRGLAKESTLIPRLYNRPEIVIINLY